MTPGIIYLVVPAMGAALFLALHRKMAQDRLPDAPVAALFTLFLCYGGWLLVWLTEAHWHWSAAASIGLGYLLIAAPIVQVIVAWQLTPVRGTSGYHRVAWLSSAAYPVLVLIWIGWVATRGIP